MDITDQASNLRGLGEFKEGMREYEFKKANKDRAKEGQEPLTREQWRSQRARKYGRTP